MKYDPVSKSMELNEREATVLGRPWVADKPYPQSLADIFLVRTIERIDEIGSGCRGMGGDALSDPQVVAGLSNALSEIVQSEIQTEAANLLGPS